MGRKITGPLEMIGGGDGKAISAQDLYASELDRLNRFMGLASEPGVDELPIPINIQGVFDQTVQTAESQAEHIAVTAEAQATQVIADANTEGQQIIENARQEAEKAGVEIRQQAQEDAVDIREDAHRSAAEEGRQEGLTQGKEEGIDIGQKEGWEQSYKEGWAQGYQEYTEATEQLKTFLSDIRLQKQGMIEKTESDLIGLVFDIVERIIHNQISNDNVVYNAVKSALQFAVGSETLEIRVNPGDVQKLDPHRDEFYSLMEQLERLDIVEDPEISRGGCVVLSNLGQIDLRLETQLNQVEQVVQPQSLSMAESKVQVSEEHLPEEQTCEVDNRQDESLDQIDDPPQELQSTNL